MPKHILAWQCQYCGDLKKTYNIALRHEKSCLKNPDGQNCINCKKSYIDEGGIDGGKQRLCGVDDKPSTRAKSADCEWYEPKELY